MSNKKTDLDVAMAQEVPTVLRNAAEEYYDASGDLEAAWQDPKAGKIWVMMAKELERSATKIDKILKKYY